MHRHVSPDTWIREQIHEDLACSTKPVIRRKPEQTVFGLIGANNSSVETHWTVRPVLATTGMTKAGGLQVQS